MVVSRFLIQKNSRTEVSIESFAASQDVQTSISRLTEAINRVEDELATPFYFYGDQIWFTSYNDPNWQPWVNAFLMAIDENSDGGQEITTAERSSLLAMPLPAGITPAMAGALLDRVNRTIDYYNRGIFTSTKVPAGLSTDFYALDIMSAKSLQSNASIQASIQDGFAGPVDEFAAALEGIASSTVPTTEGVCASASLSMNEQAVMTRQAFAGTLSIENEDPSSAISNLNVTIDIRDANGNSANDKFFVEPPVLLGLNDVNGSGNIASGATGEVRYTFIPTNTAAPSAPTQYTFSGTLQYSDGTQTVSVPLLGSPVTVYPNAHLVLNPDFPNELPS
jgi:hypothetical protein